MTCGPQCWMVRPPPRSSAAAGGGGDDGEPPSKKTKRNESKVSESRRKSKAKAEAKAKAAAAARAAARAEATAAEEAKPPPKWSLIETELLATLSNIFARSSDPECKISRALHSKSCAEVRARLVAQRGAAGAASAAAAVGASAPPSPEKAVPRRSIRSRQNAEEIVMHNSGESFFVLFCYFFLFISSLFFKPISLFVHLSALRTVRPRGRVQRGE